MSGTVISSAAVNDDLSDIATALTASLPRDGQAGMSGQLKLADGSVGAPSLTFSTDLTTGLFKGGSGIISVSISGVQIGTFTSAGWTGVASGSIPIGTVVDFMGASTPSKWILCYGQNVSRTTYAALFTALGTTYGAGDGLTTFGLPDLRGRTLFGKDNMGGSSAGVLTTSFYGTDPTVLGNKGGSQNHVLTVAELPTGITVNGTVTVNTSGGEFLPTIGGTNWGGGTQFVLGTGGNAAVANGTVVNRNSLSATNTLTSNNTSGTAHTIVSPGMVVNKIIFAGA